MEPEVTKPADGMTDYGLIELSGSENTRDQGGMETVTGQRVRAKKLIRSDKLEKLTDHDIHVLVDEYELRTVIDLRTDKERELSPDPTSRMPEVRESSGVHGRCGRHHARTRHSFAYERIQSDEGRSLQDRAQYLPYGALGR